MHDQIGLHPKIIRKVQGNPCPWCANLAGVYDYPCDSAVFKRHANCSCIIEYNPGDGKRIRNAFTKRWTGTKKIDRIVARKKSGADATAFLNDLAEHPAKLGAYTPETLKKELEDKGCAVTPLSSGNYKDISFENGDGYKTNFGGDGLLM